MLFLSFNVHFHIIYVQFVYLHSVAVAQNELNEATADIHTSKQTNIQTDQVTFLNLYIDNPNIN